jgi:hypothetical protein
MVGTETEAVAGTTGSSGVFRGAQDGALQRVRDSSRWLSAARAAGILVPLALLTLAASNTVLAFDGGMNLQVSASVAAGHGYAWDYGGHTVSPYLIQTSGVFVLLGALAIKLFGTGALALELPNLFFLGLLLLTVARAFKPWRWLQIVAPTLFLLITPAILEYGLRGYGEFAVGFFMVAAFLVLSAAVEGAGRPLVLCSVASASIGLSLTTKTITVAELPVLLAGYAIVGVARPDVSRWRLAATSLWCVLPVATFEVYRVEQFGSLTQWRHYWSRQLRGVGDEATAPTSIRRGLTNAPKGWSRISSLDDQIGLHAPTLIVAWLVLPLIVLAVSYYRRTCTRREWLARPRCSLEVLLAGVVTLYVPWYVFVSPLDWLRHFMVGAIAVSLLYLLMVGRLVDARGARTQAIAPDRSVGRVLGAAVTAIAALMAAVVLAQNAHLNGRYVMAPDRTELDAERAASQFAAGLARDGSTLCGSGLLSAPVISLTARVPFCDLEKVDACVRAFRADLTDGNVYLVWDQRSEVHYPGGPPRSSMYSYAKIADPSSYASLWRVSLRGGGCNTETPR